MATALLPEPPHTQALQSTTFRPPPLDGSLTLPEIYDWHLQNTPNHRLFVFSDDDGNNRTIYWPEAVKAVYKGTQFLRSSLGWRPNAQLTPIVAILAASDTITYFTVIMAIMRAGYVAFPISPRNSPSAVAHLIQSVGIQYILVGREKSMLDLSDDSIRILKEHSNVPQVKLPQLINMPLFHDLFVEPSEDVFPPPYERKGPDEIIMYLHSSGSTAYPKPIGWTNRRFAQVSLIPYFGERDLTNQIFSLHTMPMYHGMGVLQCCWTAYCGLVVSAFEPRSPAQIPTPDNLFQAAVATQSDIIFCVPAIIEAWSRNSEYVRWLATRGGVLFGGGPLNKAAGDYMTSQGVAIFILYGSTEGGIMSPILPAQVGYDWEYFKFPDLVKPEMIPNNDNTFELVMMSNVFCRPSVINTKISGIESYATSDLLTPHPTKPGYWRIYGRTDDQIMHNTGEKTNPSPLENILNQDPHVQSSVMFGRGHLQAGVIIDPKPAFKFHPSDETKLAEFRNRIWPTIQKMNKFAPQHSRLFKEMVLVAKPDKPFQYTAKSTARRQAIINEYADEIETVYAAVDATTQTNIPLPTQWDIVNVTKFIREVVNSVLVHKVADNDDLFQHGCDSLQATWIRNTLTRALRDGFQLDTRERVDNFVYEYPSISGLATFIVAHVSGNNSEKSSDRAKEQAMTEMVANYSKDFQKHCPADSGFKIPGQTILLTGSTGGLGSYILSVLVEDEAVGRIYCLNRPSKEGSRSLIDRQRIALDDKGLPTSKILESKKLILLEGRLEEKKWGLETDAYEEIKHSVTAIIHNAWPVDFNLALTSFEPNVIGLRGLINFALSSPLPRPPTLIFTSTIGIFQNIKLDVPHKLPEAHVEAQVAIGTGYTESKWVSEQIIAAASVNTTLRTVVARVGQISGGPNGFWSPKEWFPSLVQSAKLVSCLPRVNADVSWIPIEVAAKSLVDFTRSAGTGIVHLISPKPIPWSALANTLSDELSVPQVAYHEWLSKLEHVAAARHGDIYSSTEPLAALRLLGFYRKAALRMDGFGSSFEAFGFSRLSNEHAVKLSSTLADPDLEQLSSGDVKNWLAYWRTVGFL